MKKLLMLGVSFVLAAQVCGVALAGDKKCGSECSCCADSKEKCDKDDKAEDWQAKRTERLSKKLDLTSEQKTKLDAILKEDAAAMKPEMDKKREERKAEMEKMRAEMKARMDAQDVKIKAILTPDQVKKYDEMQKERAEKMEKMMKKHHHGDDKDK